uniref:Uncharacterized protein n=1 Tax=Wuchereria bancrofti TaxID=6293 RepID=A0AAF5PIM9_WUCBA
MNEKNEGKDVIGEIEISNSVQKLKMKKKGKDVIGEIEISNSVQKLKMKKKVMTDHVLPTIPVLALSYLDA